MLDSVLLRIAKSTILHELDSSYRFEKERILKGYPFLRENGAVFVTLNYHSDLRGCIGSIIAHRTLYDDIVHNSLSAAFHDPRFKPLERDELLNLTLEVSVLSEPEVLEYENYEDLLKKVKPYEDGLILRHGSYHGTFLPQVWSQLQTPKQFLNHLSIKAGADPSIYAHHPAIYRYRVDSIEGKFDDITQL